MNFMNFMNYDLVVNASQHHHEVSKHAAEMHLLRRSPRHRGSEMAIPQPAPRTARGAVTPATFSALSRRPTCG